MPNPDYSGTCPICGRTRLLAVLEHVVEQHLAHDGPGEVPYFRCWCGLWYFNTPLMVEHLARIDLMEHLAEAALCQAK